VGLIIISSPLMVPAWPQVISNYKPSDGGGGGGDGYDDDDDDDENCSKQIL